MPRTNIDRRRRPRKLETVHQDLTQLTEQGKIEAFLKNAGNANKLGDLLEGIRDAMIEYQVCTSSNNALLQCLIFGSDFVATGYLRQ